MAIVRQAIQKGHAYFRDVTVRHALAFRIVPDAELRRLAAQVLLEPPCYRVRLSYSFIVGAGMGIIVYAVSQTIFDGVVDMLDKHRVKRITLTDLDDDALNAGIDESLPVYMLLPCGNINYLHNYSSFLSRVRRHPEKGCLHLCYIILIKMVLAGKSRKYRKSVIEDMPLQCRYHLALPPPCSIAVRPR